MRAGHRAFGGLWPFPLDTLTEEIETMLFRQLTSSLRMGLRMLRTAVTRPFRAVWFRLRRATNLGRQFSKVVPAVTKSVTKVKLKPETRADYIDAGPVFIAKSLFVVIALVLIAGGLFVYYIGWPFVQSRFLTACLPVSDTRVETYTGRVKLYADDGKTVLLFHGKLEEGAKTGRGKEYYESGQLQYEGMFVVHFPFPEKEMRERLYRGMLPAAAPVADDVDFAFLAERVKVSGGGIKNIVLHAAFLAAEEDAPICMRHLVRSAVGELRKNEIVVVREDLREYADLAFD